MSNTTTTPSLEQPFWPVKSSETSSIDGTPDSMIHHKSYYSKRGKLIVYKSKDKGKRYGVSSFWRILTKGVFNKRYDQIVHCLRDVVSLPPCEREATLRLLRIGAYYGNVYPKASQVCSEPGCSKATFWRAVKHLKNLGLIRTIPRFRLQEEAQISDLFILHKLVLLIAKYLAEHIAQTWPPYLIPDFNMTFTEFERFLSRPRLSLGEQSGVP